MAKKKVFKVGILVSTLLIPALIYLFLKGFGTNEYTSLPHMGKLPDTTSVELKDSVAFVLPWDNFSIQSLSDENKIKVEGNLKLIHFIDPSDDDAYTTASQISRVREYMKEYENVVIITIASEEKNDKLLEYFSSSFLPGDNWSFATINDLINLTDTIKSRFILEKSINDYSFLIGPEQYVRGVYNVKDPEEMDKLIEDIMVLRNKEL